MKENIKPSRLNSFFGCLQPRGQSPQVIFSNRRQSSNKPYRNSPISQARSPYKGCHNLQNFVEHQKKIQGRENMSSQFGNYGLGYESFGNLRRNQQTSHMAQPYQSFNSIAKRPQSNYNFYCGTSPTVANNQFQTMKPLQPTRPQVPLPNNYNTGYCFSRQNQWRDVTNCDMDNEIT